jgi:hypothetical protein
MTSTNHKTYSDLSRLATFEDRFDYLRLGGGVGERTFGFDRYINQQFYASREWQEVRAYVIVRDEGCDLGIPGYEIYDELLIHHMNPMNLDDILRREDWILDPEYLITTQHNTHNAIHYGASRNLHPKVVPNREPGDTRLW